MRLTLWNVGVLATVLAMFGAALRVTSQAKLTRDIDLQLRHHAAPYIRDWSQVGMPPPLPPDGFGPGPGAGRGEWGPGGPGPGGPEFFERRFGGRGFEGRRFGGRGFGEWGPGPPPRPEAFPTRDLNRAGLSPTGGGPWDPKGFTAA